MILWSAVGIISDSVNILLESLPKGMSLESVAAAMLRVEGVKEVHDVHIWSLGSNSQALSCHVHILDMPTSESEQIAHQVREVLAHEFGYITLRYNLSTRTRRGNSTCTCRTWQPSNKRTSKQIGTC